MRLGLAGFREPIVWAIQRNDPALAALDEPAGWILLNPSLAVPDMFLEPYQTRYYFQLPDGTVYLQKFQLAFLLPDTASDEEIGSTADSLLRRLRFVTKQVSLPTSVIMTDCREVEAMPPSAFPADDDLARIPRPDRISDSFYDAPATMTSVRESGSLPADFAAPIYDQILMDAMASLVRNDYRTTILYAAIAVETLAGVMCEQEHERLFTSIPCSDTVRSVTLSQSGGKISIVDPIYRHLVSSNKFSILLSELPLYVFRRSMLQEEQSLYQQALRLYGTRNKIAHRGEAPVGSDVFPSTREGAISALECAIKVFAWFGAPGKYHIPRGKWRKIKPG